MWPEFQIGKHRKVVPEKEIEDIIKDLFEKTELRDEMVINLPSEKFPVFNEFQLVIHSICCSIPVS